MDDRHNPEDFDGDTYNELGDELGDDELLEEDTELYQDELEQLDRLDDEPE